MNKTNELTVEEAAALLGVTPRSVVNYIKSKEIEAIKVGKAWFINPASLDAFKKRYGFSSHTPEVMENFRKISEPHKNREKKELYPVHNLKLFQIAKEVLTGMNSKTIFPENRPDLEQKLRTLKVEALELLGAGFYAFGSQNKSILYNRSREKVGGILSLVYFYHETNEKLPKGILKIEEDLMPAYSSLIRKIEKKSERT